MDQSIGRLDWDFQPAYESTDINFVKAIRDWELSREVWKNLPELFEWILARREVMTVREFIVFYQERHEFRAGLWTISSEFPRKPALSLSRPELENRIRKLLPIVPLSKPAAGLVKESMGKDLERLSRLIRSDNLSYISDADLYTWDNPVAANGNIQVVFPVCVDLAMPRKAIVESFGLLLDQKLEAAGLSAGRNETKGRGTWIRQWKDDLRQLAAYRLREFYSATSGRDWWIDAQDTTAGLYSKESGVPWNRAAEAAKKLIEKREREVELLDPETFFRKHALELNQKAKELGVDLPFPGIE